VTHTIPKIIITPGDPGGIGPDICLDLLNHSHSADIYLAADPEVFIARSSQKEIPIQVHDPEQKLEPAPRNKLNFISFKVASPVQAGVANKSNSQYVLETIRYASEQCLNKRFDAMVTGPVNKALINNSGVAFTGHTEYIENICATHFPNENIQAVMMLATKELKVALLTTHVPLKEVPSLVTKDRLEKIIKIVYRDLKSRFGIHKPHLMICGLNPHAGEEGNLGLEEQTIMQPVIQQLRKQGYHLTGPLPADTIFVTRKRQNADAVLAIYHDQGLPVLKTLGFGKAVNVTLGLPIIRTSVDHGTAFELAGSGKASAGSLHTAIDFALQQISSPSQHA